MLNGTPIGGAANSTYNAPPGTIPNGAEITFEATTPGGGCAYTASVTINVASDPVATIDTNAPGDTICSGESIQITAEPLGLSYSFTIGGVPANPSDVVSNVLTTTGITTDTVVLVTVTNANGCSDTASLTVKVPYVVTPGNITAPGDTNICPGEDQPEIASAALGTTAGASGAATVTYQWQYKVGAAAWQNILGATSSNLATATFNIVETTSFRRLTQAEANGVPCDPTPSAAEVTINVDQDRNLNIATSDADNNICSSDSITFTGQNFVAGDTFRLVVKWNPNRRCSKLNL